MSRSWLVRMCVLGFLVSALGCKSDDDGGGSGGGGPAIDEIGPDIAAAVCEEVERCAGDAFAEIALGGMDCEANLVAELEDDSFAKLIASVEAGHVDYHGERVDECLEGIAKLGCKVTTQRLGSIAGCEEVFEGKAEEGADCDVDEMCAGDAYCNSAEQCPGTCKARSGSGDVCEESDECENGLDCGGAGTCEAPGKAGDPCGTQGTASCGLGFLCNGADEDKGTAGTCGTFEDAFSKKLGDSCDLQASVFCEAGLSCIANLVNNAVSFECAKLVAAGAACHFGVPSHCPDGEYCNADIMTGKVEGSCVKLPKAGDDCQVQIPGTPNCAAGLMCGSDDKCRKNGRVGDACAEDGDCASNHCDGGKCAIELCEL